MLADLFERVVGLHADAEAHAEHTLVARRERGEDAPRGPAETKHLGDLVTLAPFVAHGNVATAGGCFSSHYLAAWMIARSASLKDMEEAIHYVAPVGEKALYVERAIAVIRPFLVQDKTPAAAAAE